MAKIAVDCDGVLADFIQGFCHEANHIWPGRFPKDYEQTMWDFDPAHISKAEIDQVWERIKATDNWWLKLNAHTENVGALGQFLLTNREQDIHIVTSRVPTAGMTVAKQTTLWLYLCGVSPNVNYMGVIPVADSNRKVDIYEATGIEWSVDDKMETVEQCDKLPERKHKAFLLNRKYNSEAKVKRRIDNLTQFFSAIKDSQ